MILTLPVRPHQLELKASEVGKETKRNGNEKRSSLTRYEV